MSDLHSSISIQAARKSLKKETPVLTKDLSYTISSFLFVQNGILRDYPTRWDDYSVFLEILEPYRCAQESQSYRGNEECLLGV